MSEKRREKREERREKRRGGGGDMAKLANVVHLPGYTVHPTRYTWEFQQIFLRADHLPIVCREITDLIMVLSILTAASRPRLFSHLPCQSETNSSRETCVPAITAH